MCSKSAQTHSRARDEEEEGLEARLMTGSAWKCTSCVLDVMLLLIITEGRGAGEGRGAAFFSSEQN